jgi:hypothetical protein
MHVNGAGGIQQVDRDAVDDSADPTDSSIAIAFPLVPQNVWNVKDDYTHAVVRSG